MIIIKIYEIRISKRMTLYDLERISGIGKSTINDLENMKYFPKLDQMEILAQSLGVKITDLFDSDYK